MTKKYKIHELAKDFNIQSKQIIEMLAPLFEGEKKYQTALEERELDAVFEILSKQHAPESLDAYFAMARKPEEYETKPKKAEKAESKTAAKKTDEKKETAAKKPAVTPSKTGPNAR